jgi:hypothetical protein
MYYTSTHIFSSRDKSQSSKEETPSEFKIKMTHIVVWFLDFIKGKVYLSNPVENIYNNILPVIYSCDTIKICL